MLPDSQGARLLHLAGFGTGVLLYAMLGLMVLRAARTPGRRRDHIPFATAVLGLLWNVGAIALYGLRDLGLSRAEAATPTLLALGAIAFSALGFLPAVVVHAATLGGDVRLRRTLTTAAYALSSVASSMQLWGAFTSHTVPTRLALQLLSVGFAVVLPVLAFVLRKQRGGRGPLTAAALAAFAVMALHLSHHVGGPEAVGSELWGHHASIPLALVILYQDYRFALADLFLKRVVGAVLFVGLGMLAYVFVVVPLVLPRLTAEPSDPLAVAVLLSLWGGAVFAAWALRRLVWTFVDRVVLRRPDYRVLRVQIAADVARHDDAASVLDAVRGQLTRALSASSVTWRASTNADVAEPPNATCVELVYHGSAAVAMVPTAEVPRFFIDIGGLAPGRRLLSDDVALLDHVSTAAARRIDAIRVAGERYEREAREQDILRLATEAELRALRAQLNPHFLFNALTTIGYLIQTSPERALGTLYRLTELLRAVLRPSANELVPLEDELEIVSAYLAIERARFEERLLVTIDVSEEARMVPLPPLLLQPLVENAVKHGIAPLRSGGSVIVWARVDEQSHFRPMLHLSVTDTGAGADLEEFTRRRQEGVGVNNVERRLARHYGDAATMAIRSSVGVGTCVELWLPLDPRADVVGVGDNQPDSDTSVPPVPPAASATHSLTA
jgi:two-component system, LytTR family, sensor kinase